MFSCRKKIVYAVAQMAANNGNQLLKMPITVCIVRKLYLVIFFIIIVFCFTYMCFRYFVTYRFIWIFLLDFFFILINFLCWEKSGWWNRFHYLALVEKLIEEKHLHLLLLPRTISSSSIHTIERLLHHILNNKRKNL